MSKPKILELEENLKETKEGMPQLVKRVVLEEQTTNLVIDGLDIVKDKGTYEIVFSGTVQGNIHIIPNSALLEFSRSIITQNAEEAGGNAGNISSIVRYSSQGLWFVRGVEGVRNFTKATLKYDKTSNLAMLLSNCGSLDVNKAMLINAYSIIKPNEATNITSLKFSGTINTGAEIEIYKK